MSPFLFQVKEMELFDYGEMEQLVQLILLDVSTFTLTMNGATFVMTYLLETPRLMSSAISWDTQEHRDTPSLIKTS